MGIRTAARHADKRRMAFFSTNVIITTRAVYLFLIIIKLVVVMSAVELWKAQQPLLPERPSVAFRKWRTVGNGENTASDPGPDHGTKSSSATLNRISASSPTPIHSPSPASFAGQMRQPDRRDEQDREIPAGTSAAARPAERGVLRARRNGGRTSKLLQGIHQTCDRPIQILV
jgi:hypothetical protein